MRQNLRLNGSSWFGGLSCSSSWGILGRDKEPRKDALEAASYVGDVDERQELSIWAAFEVAVAFAEVDVQEGFVPDGTHS